MHQLVGTHWITDFDEEGIDEDYTITVDMVSDFFDGTIIHPRYLITFHRDDQPQLYTTYPWNLFMETFLRYD